MIQFLIRAGYAGQSRNGASNYGAFSSNGSSRNVNDHTRLLQIHPHFSDAGPSIQPQTITSRIANNSGNDYEKISSQQALKRTFPSSLLPSTLSSELNSSSSSQIRDTYGGSYYSAGLSSTTGKGHIRDHSSMGNDNEVLMYGNSGSRILPPSMMNVKSNAGPQFATSSESVFRSAIGEERVAESDERLIYQAALEVCYLLNCYRHCIFLDSSITTVVF